MPLFHKTRCKPGDMAVVIKSKMAANIGTVVTVIEKHDNHRGGIRFEADLGVVWWCKGNKEMQWTRKDGHVFRELAGPVPDDCLQPIRPPAPTKATRNTEDLETAGPVPA